MISDLERESARGNDAIILLQDLFKKLADASVADTATLNLEFDQRVVDEKLILYVTVDYGSRNTSMIHWDEDAAANMLQEYCLLLGVQLPRLARELKQRWEGDDRREELKYRNKEG